MIDIQIVNDAGLRPELEPRWGAAVRDVLVSHGVDAALVSLAVVDDATIRDLNRRYLAHDRPTDVLSFRLDDGQQVLEGEIVVSATTARREAPFFGWSAEDELLLYIVHGALHLVGFDDAGPEDAAVMRRLESASLERLGVTMPTPRDLPQLAGDGVD